jgi:hypothetical protein
MLVPMRMKAEGLSADEAIAKVLSENIHGLELDQRCVEIAAFAVALEAWRYPDSSGYRELPSLNIAWVGQSIKAKKEDWLSLAGDDERLYYGMEALYNTFKDAPLLGSLIDPGKSIANDLLSDGFADLQPLLNQALQQFEMAENQEAVIAAKGLTLSVDLLSQKYQLIATNVPYLARGKQEECLQDFCEKYYPEAKHDLATVFLDRCLKLCMEGGTSCIVLPQTWLYQKNYESFRKKLLKNDTWNLVARLGEGGFDSSAAAGAFVAMIIISKAEGHTGQLFDKCIVSNQIRGLDVSEPSTAEGKAEGLLTTDIRTIEQQKQLDNPDARVSMDRLSQTDLLLNFASSVEGLSTGDGERFIVYFWELSDRDKVVWEFFQKSPESKIEFSGLTSLLRWEAGCGDLSKSTQARVQGHAAWGRNGVLINLMRSLHAALYLGEKHDKITAAILVEPSKQKISIQPDLRRELWVYCSSPEFYTEVRKLNPALQPGTGTLVKVPFDFEHWNKVAEQKYPNGLPKPYSDDPTQWIFHGYPAQAESPLQVAVARLLGYHWPAESDKEMELSDEARVWIAKCESLATFVDDDGIVCLSPVRGEKAADERLEALLMAAFGDQWNGALRNQLLTEVQCSGKTLDFWLRNKFFEQHCKLFQDRPFIWHLWDGLADGFHALVNYHQLDRQNLERLIYTYLGDWIRTQDHGVKEGIDGAVLRLQAAQNLKKHLESILEGEAPYDIFVRWKPLSEQPIGWNPDINDGVRMNIRPFMAVPDVGKKEAGILRTKPNIKWTKDRGNDVATAPWYKLGLQYGESEGARINDHHLKLAEKRVARDE